MKKAIKVSFNGETKRFKVTQTYDSLALQTKEAFGQELAKVWPVKFYYVDEEQELISITTQSDFLEALSIDDLSVLKLTVAFNVQDARQQLEKMYNDNQSMTESMSSIMNQSMRFSQASQQQAFGNVPPIMQTAREQNPFPLLDMDEPKRREAMKKISHEMGVGNSNVNNVTTSVSTDVQNLVGKDEVGVNTRNTVTQEADTNTVMNTAQAGSQCGAQTKETGVDGPKQPKTVNNETQMMLEQKAQEIECNILVPSSCDEDEECMEESIDCFKCKGSQVNNKGLPCRKCNGSGQFNLKGYSSVVNAVKEEITTYCTEQFRELFKEYQDKKRVHQKDQIHKGYQCNECGEEPIRGVRYLCSQCPDYDLCAKCEAKGVHSQCVLLKIRKVSQTPHKFICKYPFASQQSANDVSKMSESLNSFVSPMKKDSKKQPRYSGRFIKESFGDKHKVQPGQEFTKSWTYRNNGETAWPQEVIFVQTSGDEMGSNPAMITQVVQPDQDYTWEVTFKAPTRSGKYTAYFRMQTGNNIRYGHKVWCDIWVEEQPAAVVQKVEEPKKQVAEEPHFDFVVEPKAAEVKPEIKADVKAVEVPALAKSKTPKDLYFEQVAQVIDPQMQSNLTKLYEFGYTNYQTNMNTLKKHCCNLESALNELLDDGQLYD